MDIEEIMNDDPELRVMYKGKNKLLTKSQKVDGWRMVFQLTRRLYEHTHDREVIAGIIAASPLLTEINWDSERWLKHKVEILDAGDHLETVGLPVDSARK